MCDNKEIILRASQTASCPFDVTNDEEVEFLLANIREGLTSGLDVSLKDGDVEGAKQLTVIKNLSPIPTPIEWRFNLSNDTTNGFAILGGMSLGLLATIESLESKINSLESLILEKDYHIRTMRESLSQVSNPYKPRKHTAAYKSYKRENKSRSSDSHKGHGDPIISAEELISVVKKGLSTAELYRGRFDSLKDECALEAAPVEAADNGGVSQTLFRHQNSNN